MLCALRWSTNQQWKKCGLNLIIWDLKNLLFYEPKIKEQGTKQKDFSCHFLKQLAKKMTT
jgi:hypothetical protein